MTFPLNPSNGAIHTVGATEFVYNSSTNQWKGAITLSVGSGSSGGSVSIGNTAPTSPSVGQLWFDESIGRLFIWNSSAWIDVSPR